VDWNPNGACAGNNTFLDVEPFGGGTPLLSIPWPGFCSFTFPDSFDISSVANQPVRIKIRHDGGTSQDFVFNSVEIVFP